MWSHIAYGQHRGKEMVTKETFATALRKAIEGKKATALSAEAGLPESSISAVLSQGKEPGIERAARLADVAGMELVLRWKNSEIDSLVTASALMSMRIFHSQVEIGDPRFGDFLTMTMQNLYGLISPEVTSDPRAVLIGHLDMLERHNHRG